MLDLLGSNWSSNCLVIVILYSWLRSFKFLFYQSINTIYHAFRNTTNRFDVKSEFHLETPFLLLIFNRGTAVLHQVCGVELCHF